MDMNYLRRRSIFDTPQDPGAYPPFDFKTAASAQGQDVTDDSKANKLQTEQPSRFSSTYADLANQEGGPANKKYRDFLDTGPQRDDYKPGKLDRLSAILAGVSEGVRHGGAAGSKAAHDILDDKYNEAQGDWTKQAQKLEAGAGLEEKDMGRRVGILKDIITQKHNEDTAAETAKYHEGLLANGRERNAKTGLHYTDITDKNTGKRSTHIIRPDGTDTSVDLGKLDFSPDEVIGNAGKKAGAEAAATEGSKIKVAKAGIDERGNQARETANQKFGNIKDLLTWKTENGIGDKYEGHVNKEGKLVYVNKSDPTDFHVTDIDTGKMSDADKQKAKIALKAAPNAAKPDTTKTTELKRDKDGKVIEAKTVTSQGTGKISVIGPNGETGKMDAAEFEEAQKHGWKKKGS